MEMGTLGKTGVSVSSLCYGTLTIGTLQANLSLEAGGELIRYAIERGICFFDTAQLYETYPYLRWGMEHAGKQDIIISSKTYAYTREMAETAVEQARRELNRDYIDLFMLHEQESLLTLKGHQEALDYLYECKAKGIIRAVGASMHHIAAVKGAIEMGLDVIHPILNRAGLGIVDGGREEMEQVLEAAAGHGIGIFTMKALGGGNLHQTAAESLSYIRGLSWVDSVAIGMQSREEIDANLSFWETVIFTSQETHALREKKRRLLIEDWCVGCGACVARCGQHALSLKKGKAVCDSESCVLCGYCSRVCRDFAIKII